MKVIILLIVVVILTSLFIYHYYNKRIKGGEFLKYKTNSGFIVPSISQVECIDTLKKTEKITFYDYLITKSLNQLKRMSSFQWTDGYASWTKIDEPHLVSDAHLDLQGLSLSLPITNALAACEWHGDEFRGEENALISLYNNNTFRIVRARELPQLEEPYIGYSAVFGYSIEIIAEDTITNLTSIIDFYNSHDVSNQHYSKEYIIGAMKIEASTLQLKKLLKACEPSINDNKALILNKLDKEVRILRYIQSYTDKANIEIYIEYSYSSGRRADEIFEIVHKHAVEVIKQTVSYYESLNEPKPLFMACYRFQLEVDKKIQYPSMPNHQNNITINLNYNSLHVDIYDECLYKDIMIPPTKESFSYDEQLYFTLNKNKYSVQIEHSENGEGHKSNFVEFLARNLVPILKLEDLKRVFARTSYLGENDIMNCKPTESGVNIETSKIYKTFGEHATELLTIVELEDTN